MKTKNKIIILLSLLVFAVSIKIFYKDILGYAVVSLLSRHLSSNAEIYEVSKIKLSKDVKIIGAYYTFGKDSDLEMTLDIPLEELKTLFPEDKFKSSTTERYLKNSDFSDFRQKWFNPDAIINFKSFRTFENDIELLVLYDASEPKMVRTYIVWRTY